MESVMEEAVRRFLYSLPPYLKKELRDAFVEVIIINEVDALKSLSGWETALSIQCCDLEHIKRLHKFKDEFLKYAHYFQNIIFCKIGKISEMAYQARRVEREIE